ncbi:MAG: DUF2232 domain-containing protein [Thermoanaerobaculia bacterium]
MTQTEMNVERAGVDVRQARATARSIFLHGLAAAAMFVSPLTVFVPAAILSAGLRNGRKGAWLAIACAAVLLVPIAALLGDARGGAAVGRMILEIGVPSALALELMLRGLLFGPVLLGTVVASFGGSALVELAMRAAAGFSPYGALVANFRATAAKQIEAYRTAGASAEVVGTMERITEAIATSYMPVLLVVVTILTFALSLTMLPRLRSGRVLVPQFLFRNLRFPDALLFGFVLGGLAPLATGPLRTAGFGLLAIVAFLYVLQGLAVLRAKQVRLRPGIFATVLGGVLLVLLTPYGITPFALFLVGLFDPFFDFRHFNRKEVPHESDSD